MGLNKDWSIKRVGKNGYTWFCDNHGCSDNNGDNVLTGSIEVVKAHALNHETVEIQEELGRVNDHILSSLLEELGKCSKDISKSCGLMTIDITNIIFAYYFYF